MSRGEGWAKLPRAFIAGIANLGDTELRVLLWLIGQREAGNPVEIDRALMQAEIGRSEDQVARTLQSLATAGRITFIPGRPLGRGRGRQRGVATVTAPELVIRPRTHAESKPDNRTRADADSKSLRLRTGAGVGPRTGAGSVLEENKREEQLARLRRSGAHLTRKGESIAEEWTELVEVHGIDAVLGSMAKLPPKDKWPSRVRSALDLIAELPGITERKVTADEARALLGLPSGANP